MLGWTHCTTPHYTYDNFVRGRIEHPRDESRVVQGTSLIGIQSDAAEHGLSRRAWIDARGKQLVDGSRIKGRRAIAVHVAIHLVTSRLAGNEPDLFLLFAIHPFGHAEQLVLTGELAAAFAFGTHEQLELHDTHRTLAVRRSTRHHLVKPVVVPTDRRCAHAHRVIRACVDWIHGHLHEHTTHACRFIYKDPVGTDTAYAVWDSSIRTRTQAHKSALETWTRKSPPQAEPRRAPTRNGKHHVPHRESLYFLRSSACELREACQSAAWSFSVLPVKELSTLRLTSTTKHVQLVYFGLAFH